MLRQAKLAGAFHIGRMSLLSVNDIPVLVLVFVESLLIGSHGAEAHAHIREATVVEKILHGHLAGEVGEHHDTVVGTLVSTGIAQRRHTVGKVEELVHALHTGTGRCHRGRLGNGIDTDMMLTAVDVTETAGDTLQQRLRIRHVIVTVEGTLGCNVRQCHDGAVIVDGIELLGTLNHLVERNGRDVERGVEHLVVQVIVCTVLADVR